MALQGQEYRQPFRASTPPCCGQPPGQHPKAVSVLWRHKRQSCRAAFRVRGHGHPPTSRSRPASAGRPARPCHPLRSSGPPAHTDGSADQPADDLLKAMRRITRCSGDCSWEWQLCGSFVYVRIGRDGEHVAVVRPGTPEPLELLPLQTVARPAKARMSHERPLQSRCGGFACA